VLPCSIRLMAPQGRVGQALSCREAILF